MLTIRSFFSNFFSLFFILFHLGCFTFSSRHHDTSSLFKKKLTLPSQNHRLLLPQTPLLLLPHSTAAAALFPIPIFLHALPTSKPAPHRPTRRPTHEHEHDIAPYIHPCSVCGEIFQAPSSLQHHQSTKHAISELVDGENIVRIIFKMGWPEKKATTPTIHRILKIHNAPKVVARFEEHRESVKSKAAADGNELLRFYCTTFICGLDSTICSHQFCSACGIIRYGFSQKLDGIPTLPTSWKAYAAVADLLFTMGPPPPPTAPPIAAPPPPRRRPAITQRRRRRRPAFTQRHRCSTSTPKKRARRAMKIWR